MGNTADYPAIRDQITICPNKMDPGATTWMLPSTCNSHNAVQEVYCNDFLTACPDKSQPSAPDTYFYFRL